MRVALVHDYLTQFGGAERVLMALMELFPHAPVFTLVRDRHLPTTVQKPGSGEEAQFRTSFLQRFPGSRRHHRYFPLLMPLAVEQFDSSQYDIVLSATHSFGKGIIAAPSTLHLSYCFTPIRYIWDDSHRYVREFSRRAIFQRFAPLALSYLRLWDYFASQRVDAYITLSHYTAARIRKYYHREATVIPPPVDVGRFHVTPDHNGYYLIVSRLVPYKRIDIAIDACERLGRPLKIVGTGPEAAELSHRAGKWTQFLGFIPDEALPALYAGARALLFPQEEDFGITPLEAAASGKPTVAYAAGGARETVIDGVTGVFFPQQDVGSLIEAMRDLEARQWDTTAIRQHAETFGKELFLRRMKQEVHNQWMAFQQLRA